TDGLKPRPQDHARATYATKLTRDTARIAWAESAERVTRLIRALDPKPGAWTELEGREVKLFGARTAEGEGAGEPGTIRTTDDGLLITTGGGAVLVEEVQTAGKPRMTAVDWVRGRGVRAGRGRRFKCRGRGGEPSRRSTRSRLTATRKGTTGRNRTRHS